MTQNTFKPTPKYQPVISEKELAIYKHVKLKLAYEKRAVEEVAIGILKAKYKTANKALIIAHKATIYAIIIAVIGLIIKHIC